MGEAALSRLAARSGGTPPTTLHRQVVMRRGREFYPPKRKCTGPLSHCGTPWGMWGTPIYVTEILMCICSTECPTGEDSRGAGGAQC